jgi:hypothetical protein
MTPAVSRAQCVAPPARLVSWFAGDGDASDRENRSDGGGFIISGHSSKVIVRAIGSSLSSTVPGALSDTVLALRDGSGSLVASNDDCRRTQEQEIIDTTVAPKDDRESAIVATLAPRNYTGIARGKDDTTGVALVEVHELQ